MALEQHTLSDLAHFDEWPSEEDPHDSWFGAEIQAAPGYNALTHTITGGFYSIEGDSTGVTIQNDTGTKLEAFDEGDPGYHVHLIRAPGCPAFDMRVSLVYSVLI